MQLKEASETQAEKLPVTIPKKYGPGIYLKPLSGSIIAGNTRTELERK